MLSLQAIYINNNILKAKNSHFNHSNSGHLSKPNISFTYELKLHLSVIYPSFPM